MHEEPKSEISAEHAMWRIRSRLSLSPRRYYVDYVSNERWGKLELIADNLTQEEATWMAQLHNNNLTSA